MRKVYALILLVLLLASVGFAQKKAAKPAAPAAANPTAILDTSAGKITCTLFQDKAPITVANFIGLADGTKEWINPASGARKRGVPMYSGTIFHRVDPNFMIQGGSPTGDGAGDPGFTIADEFRSDLKFDRPGRLAMANEGRPHTGGSQFFITVVPTPHLNGKHPIFGQCANLDVVKKIARAPRDKSPGPREDRPFNPVMLNKVIIVRPGEKPPAAPVPKKSGK